MEVQSEHVRALCAERPLFVHGRPEQHDADECVDPQEAPDPARLRRIVRNLTNVTNHKKRVDNGEWVLAARRVQQTPMRAHPRGERMRERRGEAREPSEP